MLRGKATEAPFSGKFLNHNAEGIYSCAACKTPLFKSDSKFESTLPGLIGWPSFSDVISKGNVELRADNDIGVQRTEVVCKTCGGHLGHLFNDETSSTGKHYCINSVALGFSMDTSSPK